MVTTTLDRMAAGGIFDHLGGGFHRYCVDDRWLVPHFEKMLYDNALLAVCYLEAWQATGREEYAGVVRRTLDYLLHDMTDPHGGFYSGEDADSEGEEGKFYLWTPDEIRAVLQGTVPIFAGTAAKPWLTKMGLSPLTPAELFCRVYDVTEEGNFEGRNILHLTRPLDIDVKLLGCEPVLLAVKLDEARQRLLAARAKRIRPGAMKKSWLVGTVSPSTPWPKRERRSTNLATRPPPIRPPISYGTISAATTAACCITGATVRRSTTPISTITPASEMPC